MKLYQLFEELQGHESNVAQLVRELTGGPLALVSHINPLIPAPSMSDPFKTIQPVSRIQPTFHTPPVRTIQKISILMQLIPNFASNRSLHYFP